MRSTLLALSFFVAACGGSSQAPDDMMSAPDLGHTQSCTAVRDALLTPIDSVSAGAVSVISTTGSTQEIYVDASVGGINGAATHPRVYISLATALAVAVTDKTAQTSTAWDLALKRPVIFVNGGDGGPGHGATQFLAGRDFATVTAADASALVTEQFFDSACNPLLDPTGEVKTTFSVWYNYDQVTHMLSPAAGTFIVRGATDLLYKVAIDNYYGTPTGGTSTAGGRYVMRIAPL
jgi:hypothetical protein